MKVTLDPQKCQGHGRCFSLAPEVFDCDDLGNGFVIGDGSIADEELERTQLAADNCPEHAITLEA